MSPLAYYADWFVIPALIALVWWFGAPSIVGATGGAAAWTLAEYLIHRHLFHEVPFFQPAHVEHHENPCGRTGVRSWQSGLIFAALALVLPAGPMIGFAAGYLAYITAHHAVHHWTVRPGSPLYALKMRHAAHHRGVEANFGVVTTLWDRAFGTYRPWRGRR